MKNHQKKRGLLAGLGAMAAAAALVLSSGAAASALLPMPDKSGLVITKLEQPGSAGAAATGEQAGTGSQPALSGTPIEDVVFKAYPVTVPYGAFDGSAAWQASMAGVTLAAAQAEVDDTAGGGANPVTEVRTGTTDGFGVVSWTGANPSTGDLPAGLYLIRETDAPADVVRAGDFLVALPLTNPTDRNAWLSTVYVYPKNSKVGVEKTVENAQDLVVGDEVTWTIEADIPGTLDGAGKVIPSDAYEIHDTLTNTQLALVPAFAPGGPNTGITVSAGATGLVEGTDYDVVADTTTDPTKTTYKIVLTAAGRTAIAAELDGDSTAKVVVTIDTTVKLAEVIGNTANVYPNQKAIDDSKPLPSDPVEVRYGKIQLVKDSSDAGVVNTGLAGAEFKVYLTEDDAKAAGGNNLKPAAQTPAVTGYDALTGIWTTQPGGAVDISGLRYTDYADGEQQNPFVDAGPGQECTDPVVGTPAADCVANGKYQTYWLVEVKALDGHQLAAEPVEFSITANTSNLTDKQTFVNQKNTNGFVLPLTGGMGTAFLTFGGIALLAVVLIVARRRRAVEAAE